MSEKHAYPAKQDGRPPLPARKPLAVKQYNDISASDQARQHNGDVFNNSHNTHNYYGRAPSSSNVDDCSALWEAAANGHTDRVKYLVRERGIDIDQADHNGMNALHHASLSGFHDTVQFLISAGANVNVASQMGTPLCLAVLKERSSIVRLLLEARADLNSPGGYFGSALHVACYVGSLPLIETLRSSGARTDVSRMFIWSEVAQIRHSEHKTSQQEGEDFTEILAVDVASRCGFRDIVQHLQQSRPSQHPQSAASQSAPQFQYQSQPEPATQSHRYPWLPQQFSTQPQPQSSQTPNSETTFGTSRPDGLSPLARACVAGDILAVQALINSGADVRPTRDLSRDPVIVAAGSTATADPSSALMCLINARGRHMRDEVWVAAIAAAKDARNDHLVEWFEAQRYIMWQKDDSGKYLQSAGSSFARYM